MRTFSDFTKRYTSYRAQQRTTSPLLRPPRNPLSGRTKFLIGSAVAALLVGYFIFAPSHHQMNAAMKPQLAIDTPAVAAVPFVQNVPPSVEGDGIMPESKAEPEFQTTSLQPTVRLNPPNDSEIEARSPQTIPSTKKRATSAEPRATPEVKLGSITPDAVPDPRDTKPVVQRGAQSVTASERASFCFPSASAVRQDQPGAWPSWTLRAPGHEGTKCWYAATRTTTHDHQSR